MDLINEDMCDLGQSRDLCQYKRHASHSMSPTTADWFLRADFCAMHILNYQNCSHNRNSRHIWVSKPLTKHQGLVASVLAIRQPEKKERKAQTYMEQNGKSSNNCAYVRYHLIFMYARCRELSAISENADEIRRTCT